MKIGIIGDGGWGTANALLLLRNGHDVTLWGAFPEYVQEMKETRSNRKFLPGVELPASLKLTADRREVAQGMDVVVFAPPSKYFAAVCGSFKEFIGKEQLVVSLTKGLCEASGRRMTEIATDILGVEDVVALAGPTHAEEVARGIPTAIVAASSNIGKAEEVQRIWSGPDFRVYTSNDPAGVEIGGAVKNVIALAVGCSDGMGFGDNTRAALITRSLAEMNRLVLEYGGKRETLSGLAGIGDLIVTCTSVHSRNHRVGERLGKGEKIADILNSMEMVAEGVWNSKVIWELSRKYNVEMPVCDLVYSVCHEGCPAADAVAMLMSRKLKPEIS
ncbi:MAG: NAD(P)-dependent glycerol-3-phosphate dehydrogenase [Kiritimatiellae bacterium]|nr:NAD(P)-dependent glycerol-3-phosphate dehydrogenase [Kiritimatiellia bacterium]